VELDPDDIGILGLEQLPADLAGGKVELVKPGLVLAGRVVDQVAEIGIVGREAGDPVEPAEQAVKVPGILDVELLELGPVAIPGLAVIVDVFARLDVKRDRKARVAVCRCLSTLG
jgi:hypothetical protein